MSAEPWGGEMSDDELAAVTAGYDALDERSGGRYRAFLRQAARCDRCRADARIRPHKQPIPLLCGTADATADELRAAHRSLATYRDADDRSAGFKSIRVAPRDAASVAALRGFLDGHALRGLSIGHCGWGDLTARVRGARLRDGVGLMVLGADWYPLSQCANFLADRYASLDGTLTKFLRLLGVSAGIAAAEAFFVEHRVYLGNVLLCYRTGHDRTGTKNLDRRSFDHCADHLRRHLAAVEPQVLVTFGKEGTRTTAGVLAGAAADDEATLARLRRGDKLADAITALYARRPAPAGIACTLDARPLTYVPLHHPSYGHINKYDHDYAALRRALGLPTPLRGSEGDGINRLDPD